MIRSLRGDIIEQGDNWLILETPTGVGYHLFTLRRALAKRPSQPVRFFTHLVVREDLMALYGFPQLSEVVLFEKLLAVNGVGPKSALSIVDLGPMGEVIEAIRTGNAAFIGGASGIGRKTAGKIVLELREKFDGVMDEASFAATIGGGGELNEALSGLGYSDIQIGRLVAQIDPELKIEEQIRLALKLSHNNSTSSSRQA